MIFWADRSALPSEVMGPLSITTVTRRRPKPSNSRHLVLDCVGSGSPTKMCVTSLFLVLCQRSRSDANYL